MHLRTRTWFIISLLCFAGAVVFWQLAERKAARDAEGQRRPGSPTNAANQLNLSVPAGAPGSRLTNTAGVVTAAATNAAASVTAATARPYRTNNLTQHRLANTSRPLEDLQRSDTALLLRNALIDSTSGQPLPIPAHLKATEDSGSYVVQSRGAITEEFRRQLAQAGATIISYVPNNAYLVRMAPGASAGLRALPQVQSVLPWEPYFKLAPNLLALAVDQKRMWPGTHLNVVVFADQYDATRQALQNLDADITQETRTPFGPMLVIRPPIDTLATIAQLPGVQGIEQYQSRVPMNDLARARVKVSSDVTNKMGDNYAQLTGAGVFVNVNDTGVDETHPDLTGRVFGDTPFTLRDFDGHGTHVAGIIASTGASTGASGPPGQDVPGSFTNSDFHGMAPAARIFAMPIDLQFGPYAGDAYLQETAALTNAFISNNSWGYPGDQDYTFSSASWDAAARDALPGVTGPQPLTLVFAAGNSGDGEDDGTGGLAGSVSAPATAKNVITVGAIESFRKITNEVTEDIFGEIVKTPKWLGMTDSSNQVTRFSSRGNVGIGVEGNSGRRKPDVVAPGSFIASARSSDYVDPSESIVKLPSSFPNQTVPRGRTNQYTTFVPFGGTRMIIQVISNSFSPSPFPDLPIMVRQDDVPGPGDFQGFNRVDMPVTEGTWFFSVGNSNSFDVRFDLRIVISIVVDVGDELQVLGQINEKLKPNYRFETGTSQATPVVTGMLALMEEFFSGGGTGVNTNRRSPALMKALLINGARALEDYFYEKTSTINFQGWGLVNLTNSIPEFIADGTTALSGSTLYYDQSVDRALVTGQTITRNITLSAAAQNAPLRITLVWTDPPANPSVGSKLVNDLDLYVTNLVTREVYVGNNFGALGVFTSASTSNAPSADVDSINNVENVFLNRRTADSYAVSVVARRVDVNALTTHPYGIAQDFALVISSEAPTSDAITVVEDPPTYDPATVVTILTNGVPLLDQRVGANSPQIADTYGATNQWHFFVVTNQLPLSDPNSPGGQASYMAFRTFLPQNGGLPRYVDADIDLYVTEDSTLTNFNTAAIDGAFKSLRRGGSESIVLSNLTTGTLFYVGVKSEDQQSARFAIFAISSSTPFSNEDENGNIIMRGVPYVLDLPDGTTDTPQGAFVFLFPNDDSRLIRNVIVTNTITHGQGGDLIGILSHEQQLATLNNHRPFVGTETYIYDDSDQGLPFTQPVDGPGSLLNFVGQDVSGDWMVTFIDNSQFHTGTVDYLVVAITPQQEGTNDLIIGGRRLRGICETIPANSFSLPIPVQVPGDATNLFACAAPENGLVEVYVRRQDTPGQFPTRNNYDTFATFSPPGDCLSLTKRDSPPLSQGLYIVRYYNPNSSPLKICHGEGVDRDPSRTLAVINRSPNSAGLFDDATTNRIIHVNRDQIVADVEVGVRIAHPRASDLVLHLVSPSGTRILLAENRGGLGGQDYGSGELRTDVLPSTSAGDENASTNVIGTLQNEGTLQINYQFYNVPDQITIYYDGNLIYDSGLISGAGAISVDYGPGLSTNVVVVMNENGNPNADTLWDYVATVYTGFIYATFSENPDKAKIPIKFATAPFTNQNYFATNVFTNATILVDGFEDGQVDVVPYGLVPPQNVSGWTVNLPVLTVGNSSNSPPWFINPDTGFRFLDINGETPPGSVFTNFPTTVGSLYRVSFAYSQGDQAGLGTDASAYVFAGPINGNPDTLMTVTVPPTPSGGPAKWNYGYFDFTASSTDTRLEIDSASMGSAFDSGTGVLFDSFKVDEIHTETVSGIYFLPEESLSPLRGENAFGDWKLEIWDSRAGAAGTNLTLLAWRLNLTFVETNPPAYPLTNGFPYCGLLRSNEMAFFRVDVPITAAAATNSVISLQGLDVDLIFSQFGEPIPLEPPDTFFLNLVPYGTNVLDIAGWNSFDPFGFAGGSIAPTLQPGRRYYLAVRNRYPGNNDFCIQVDFDQLSPNLTDVIPLTNNQCFHAASTVAGIDYYSFDVSSNALGAEFVLTNIIGSDVDLVIHRGVPLPTLLTNDFASTNALGVGFERIEVDDFFGTLLPGRWYIGVVHRDDVVTSYTLCVNERKGVLTPLISGRTNCSFALPGQVLYYRIDISSNAYLADFLTTNTFGNVDLFISTNTMTPLFEAPTNALYAATNAAGDELIRVGAEQLINPLTPGRWFLAVVNTNLATANYCVMVRQYETNFPYITLTNGIPYCETNSIALPVGLFRFDVATNALQAVFETFGATDDVDLYIRRALPVPPPGPRFNTYSSTNSGTTNEYIALLPPNRVPRLQPGTWYISVVPKNPLTASIPFKIRVTQILSNEVVSLANGVAYCRTNVVAVDTNQLHSGVQFYSFVVPPNSIQAMFETFGATTNVDLYIQYNLPITNYSLLNTAAAYPYASTNGGLTNEFRCLTPASVPQPLTNGTWYLAVVNRGTNHSSTNGAYCIRASVLSRTNVTRLVDNIEFCAATSVTNGGPIAGVNYYVFNVASNAILATFETLNAFGDADPPYPADVDIYLARDICLTNFATFDSTLTNYPYSSATLGTAPEFIALTTNSLPVNLAAGDWFMAVVNRATNSIQYCVRASQTLATNVVPIDPGTPACRTIGAGGSGTNASIQYLRFNVSTSAVATAISTYNADGDIDIFVAKTLGFAGLDPTRNYPYSSANPGLTPESVTISLNSTPVALTNGEWFVAVVNRSTTNVNYCLSITEIQSSELVPLTNGAACSSVPVTNSIGNIGVIYHPIIVSSNVLQLTVESFSANGNVDLYLQKGLSFLNSATFPPGASNAPYASTLGGRTNELICISTSSKPVPLSSGEWYLAVVNRENTPVNYCVRTTELLDSQVTELTNGVHSTNGPQAAGSITYYRYTVSSNAVRVNFEILQPDADVDMFVEAGLCPADVFSFTYSSTNAGTANELVSVTVGSQPVPLVPGDWFIAVRNKSLTDANYILLVTEILPSQITALTNRIPYTNIVAGVNSLTNLPVDYYRFRVSSNAVRAQFEILQPNGDVNLYVRKGLPVPAPFDYDYRSVNAGTGEELVNIFTNSTPVRLTPGDWYLAVVNTTTNPVRYIVLATEFTQWGTNFRSSAITASSSNICFTWTGTLPGVNYYVQGKPNLDYTNWFAVSPTIKAVTNEVSWCVSLPSSYHFFQLVEGLSGLSAGPATTLTGLSLTTNVFTWQWTADPSLRFGVEWTDTWSPPYWQPFPSAVTSTNGTFTFVDDGSQTGGFNATRFYRIQVLP